MDWQGGQQQQSPVDDRQYYSIINAWTMTLIGIQAQSLQMLQFANLWMAQQAYIEAVGKDDLDALLVANTPYFCSYAQIADPNTAIYAAAQSCGDNEAQTKNIYANL